MKKIIVALLLALPCVAAASPYKGILDLGHTDPEAVVFRELYSGMWLAGGQEQVWHLQNMATNKEVFHVSGFFVTRMEGQDTLYGPSVGINVGQGIKALAGSSEVFLALTSIPVPGWLANFSNFTSLEAYGGYRFQTSPDDSKWGYGYGFKVTVPVSVVLQWAQGRLN